jgi:hypothetical protein
MTGAAAPDVLMREILRTHAQLLQTRMNTLIRAEATDRLAVRRPGFPWVFP